MLGFLVFRQATIRSTVQVTNNTDLLLEVRALCSVWPVVISDDDDDDGEGFRVTGGPGYRSLGCVAPGCTLDVPVKMAYASHLQMRPSSLAPAAAAAALSSGAIGERKGDGATESSARSYEWSAALPVLANNVDTSRDDWVSCREVAGDSGGGGGGVRPGSGAGREGGGVATVRLAVHAETTPEGCVVVTVLPPVTVVNCLPCPLRFRVLVPPVEVGGGSAGIGGGLQRRDSATSGSRAPVPVRMLETGRVPTGETACLHTLEVGDGARVSLTIAHHGWSAPDMLLPATREELRAGLWAKRQTVFKLPCGGGGGGFLEVRCHFEPRVGPACPALRLHVYCSHWLVDRSGLRLGFGVSEKRRLSAPLVRPGDGADKEHEDHGVGDAAVLRSAQQQQVHVSPVDQLSCVSNKGVMLSTARAGAPLYTDREYVWKADSLPRSLRGATMIRTACSDKHNNSQHFLRFRVLEASTVHVLFDRRCQSPPGWLNSGGFRLTTMRAHVNHALSRGRSANCPFVVWSRDAAAGSWVNLGGNMASKADTMYVVIVTEEDVAVNVTATSAAGDAAATKRKITTRDDLDNSWAIGTEGLAMCNSPEGRVRVAVPEGAGTAGGRDYGGDGFVGHTRDSWSDDLDVPAGTHGVFQVDGTRGEVYELAVRAESCPGTFRRTTQVTVVPRYCVVNLLDGESIWLKQPGAPDSSAVAVPPGGRLPWHWMGGREKGAGVRVKTAETAWSYGDVVIDRVGTTALHIPFFGEDEHLDGQYRGQAGGPPMKMPERSGGAGGSVGGGGKGEKVFIADVLEAMSPPTHGLDGI